MKYLFILYILDTVDRALRILSHGARRVAAPYRVGGSSNSSTVIFNGARTVILR
jgi:hypothetical protein